MADVPAVNRCVLQSGITETRAIFAGDMAHIQRLSPPDTFHMRRSVYIQAQTTTRRWELDVNSDDHPLAQPRAEQFDALVRELYPKIRQLSPHLSDTEALRAAARMAEYRLDDEATLMWGLK